MVDDSTVCDDFTQTQLQVHFSLQNTHTQIHTVNTPLFSIESMDLESPGYLRVFMDISAPVSVTHLGAQWQVGSSTNHAFILCVFELACDTRQISAESITVCDLIQTES